MDTNSNRNRSFLICLTLMLITFAVYYQVHSFEFINYDDPVYVYQNPNIQAGITLNAVKWAFTTNHTGYWHPLTWLSLMLDYQLFKDWAGGYHIVNALFHIINTLVLFYVLMRMTGAVWPSAFVAALFALHPLHVESVAWISERKDLLSTFLWLLTIWAYIRFVSQPKITRYLPVVLFLVLGLMAKPMLVSLPFVLLLLDYWPLERIGTKRSLLYLFIEKVPLFIIVLVLCIATFIAQKESGAIYTEDCGFPVRLANASISYVQYIIKMIWPAHLAIFYPHPGQNVSIPYAVISSIFLLIVTVLVFRFAGNRKYLVTGWFWYLGTLVPVIGLVQVGVQAMADRYTYMTLTGLFVIIAWGLPELLAKWTSASSVESRYKKIVLAVSAMLIVSVLAVYTYFHLGYWRNSQILFQHALDVTGDNYTMHLSISESLREQGKLNEAIYHCSQAVRIKPEGFMAHIRLGYILCDAGRLDEAVGEYRKCLQMRPDDPNTLNTLGTIVGQLGRFDEAVKYFTQALRIAPDFADAHTNMGFALTFQGKLDEAAAHLTESLRLDPNSALAHYHLGRILAQQGKIDQAIAHFKQAVQIDPNDANARNSLNLALSEKQKLQNKDTENEKKAGRP